MELSDQNFMRDEQVSLRLRRLFENRGFKRVRVNRFEEYSLYMDNRNFLDTDNIITFMDMDGRLMALKPDITLSIIKNISEGVLPASQKLYYIDEVYRLSRESREYHVHSQIGVELVGDWNGFTSIEILDLALNSLRLISDHFVLDISHLGFISGLLSVLSLTPSVEREILQLIHAKNTSDLAAIMRREGVSEQNAAKILSLTEIHGSLAGALPKAAGLICNEEMQQAYDQMARLSDVLQKTAGTDRLQLDFSVVNDLDYYNGLVFRGYVEGIPSLVLTGGRYDNLMKKMKKKSGAVGFAISLDDLNTYFKSGRQYDFDCLITYPPGCDHAALLQLMQQFNEQGKSVRLEPENFRPEAAGFTCREHYCYRDGTLVSAGEVAEC